MRSVASKNHPLVRSVQTDVEWRMEPDQDGVGFRMFGYAARFGEATEINSWEGRFSETIARGAFAKTISEKKPVLQFNHGKDPAFGEMPIGAIDLLEERDEGLWVEATLHDNDHVKPVRDAIKSGALSGMSFQFRVVKDDWDETREIPERTIREVELFELGPVVFPAYPTTTVGVRSFVSSLPDDLVDQVVEAVQARIGAAEGTPSDGSPVAAGSGTSAPVKTRDSIREAQLWLLSD